MWLTRLCGTIHQKDWMVDLMEGDYMCNQRAS